MEARTQWIRSEGSVPPLLVAVVALYTIGFIGLIVLFA